MSHIDSYDHEYIGRFMYLPVYHPLQEVEQYKWGDEDFGFTPANLIIGGGSGEHPGLVIHKLEACVARFLLDALSDDEYKKLSKEDQGFLNDMSLVSYEEVFEYCGWRLENRARFFEAMNSPAVFGPIEDQLAEDWLMGNIGELVYFSLPELNPEQERMKSIVAPFRIHEQYGNICCVPPGYPPQGGRKIVDGKVIWGNHRW